MKRLSIVVLIASLFTGSLFASENNSMMNMSKEKCMGMHKSMHESMHKNNSSQELSTFEKHQNILNPDRSDSQLYEG